MSAEQKSIDPTPLGNITTGIVLLTLWPILFGVADTTAMIAVLPWSAMALLGCDFSRVIPLGGCLSTGAAWHDVPSMRITTPA